jgi:predicted dehydrogenase
VSAGRKNSLRFEVDGSRAALAWDAEAHESLWIGRRDAPNAELLRDPALLAPAAAALAHYPGGHEEGWPDALRNLLLEFYAAVSAHREGRDHEASVATFAEAHATMTLVASISESARAGRWIEVGDRARAVV